MLTHQIIQGEIDELKLVLTEKDLTIPSFWSCIWPGLTFMFWFLLSSYFSYGISDFSTGLDRISSMVFAAVVGIFSIIATANTRGIPGIFCLPLPLRARSCGGSASRPGITPSRRLDCWSPGYPCQPAATAWPEWACSPPAGCFVAHSMHRNGWDTGCCGPSWCC